MNFKKKYIETVIIGGGQAGLAASYHLTQHGREHVVLEQAARASNSWRNGRWDSFTLITPNWALRMPGAEYNGAEPDAFMPRKELISYLEHYIERFQLPVQYNTCVTAVERLNGKGYRLQTPECTFEAKNVLIATGFFQQPRIPSSAAKLSSSMKQIHSSEYRNPDLLPSGAVLVVGSGQSGCQIAEELYQCGRSVFLSIGSAGRVPRRYRGKDVIDWLNQVGFFDLTPEQLPAGMSKFRGIPHVSGTKGGHTLNLHQFARDGVTLFGRFQSATDQTVIFAPDLHQNLTKVDHFEVEVLKAIDGYIQANGLDAPIEEVQQLSDGLKQSIIEVLDLKAAGINTIVWAMGYSFDYSLVKLPVCDRDGFPIQMNGVTEYPGLYFVGIPWMPTEKTGSLFGVGDSAQHIVTNLITNQARTKSPV
jgi:putative flavoprotein involved in K+ transport